MLLQRNVRRILVYKNILRPFSLGRDVTDQVLSPISAIEVIKKTYSDKIMRLTEKLSAPPSPEKLKSMAEFYEDRRKLTNVIEKGICGDSGRSRLVPVGSLVTKLAADETSDIDLALITNDEFRYEFHNSLNFKQTVMNVLIDIVGELHHIDPRLKLAQPVYAIYHAHIPLLSCQFENNLKLDIQFPDETLHALRNTNLIRWYLPMDPRFPQLYLYVRTLFVALGVKNSREALFSSYFIMLLVVHFLQAKASPAVLPVVSLTYRKFVGRQMTLDELLGMTDEVIAEHIAKQPWKSENHCQVGELALEFMSYYAKFDTNTYGIDIGRGQLIKKRQIPGFTRLLLYDPYAHSTVSRSGKLAEVLNVTCKYVFNRMITGQFLDSYPEFPEASEFTLQLSKTYLS